MSDLSVLIPSRNEMFLKRTVDDVLKNIRADTDIIVVLDGAWPTEPLPDHPRLTVIHHSESHGQRAATNEAARLSNAKYVMKLDAHCMVAKGFDAELISTALRLGSSVTQVPKQYNLHAFNWICEDPACDWDKYQGPTPAECGKCGGAVKKDIVWKRRRNRLTTAWRFDAELHFQYWAEFEKTPEGKKEIAETLSCLGACFFMERERYWQLGGMDEDHGSWGQMGTEVGCKSWLSGGRMVTNKRTWYAHMFRTQGGDFGFPYPLSGKDVRRARKHSQALWLGNKWDGQVREFSWLLDHFGPVPGWGKEANGSKPIDDVIVTEVPSAGEGGGDLDVKGGDASGAGNSGPELRASEPVAISAATGSPSKGMLYYSNCVGDPAILGAVKRQLHRARNGHEAIAVTLQPLPDADRFDKALVLDLESGVLTMFKQILAGLEASTADVVFMCEHDVAYHPSHFEFVPPRRDVYYYNENTWKVDAVSGHALFYYTKQTSGLCAYRELLVEHYRKRVARVEAEGYPRSMGYEPGCHRTPRGVDDFSAEKWMSHYPNVDIRHGANLTRNRWKQSQFRDKNTCLGWTEANEVPGWGVTKGRFAEFLADLEGESG